MAETRHAGPARRTLSDRYQDWLARRQVKTARNPARAAALIALMSLVYVAAVVAGYVQYHRINPVTLLFLVAYPVLAVWGVRRTRARLRHHATAAVPSSEGWRFGAVAALAVGVIGIAAAVLAGMRGNSRIVVAPLDIGVMALAWSLVAFWTAHCIDSPRRRLPDDVAAKLARMPQTTPGGLIGGNHRVTLKLRDGRTVHRVFVMSDHIIMRVGGHWRLDFSARDVVDVENEVRAPASMGR